MKKNRIISTRANRDTHNFIIQELFTIGHSNHLIERFIDLLVQSEDDKSEES